jgi:hypothetical protein
VEGYSYSAANKNSGLTWNEATFREYIKDPKAKVPGTKMVYAGLKDDKKIDDLIAYLSSSTRPARKPPPPTCRSAAAPRRSPAADRAACRGRPGNCMGLPGRPTTPAIRGEAACQSM